MITKREIICDVCLKKIEDKTLRVVLIYKTTLKERLDPDTLSNIEKEFDVCNRCIINLNFRKLKHGNKKHI